METTWREEATHFLRQEVGEEVAVVRVAGDASFRSYYRVTGRRGTYIFMDAPPAHEDCRPFVDLARFLWHHGVAVPVVYAARLEEGLLLLEDFGDTTYRLALEQGKNPAQLYQTAVASLLAIQSTPVDQSCIAHGRPFDREMLRRELALLTDWYLEGICRRPIAPQDRERFERVFQRLLDGILQQPVVLVHRDYHSRNLMWREGDHPIGILDFQDAVMGPVTYDLASLLRDCYVAWPEPFRREVIGWWRSEAGSRLGYRPDPEQLQRDFDWMAIQRNLKAIGIFGRLSLRDGKHGYLADIPRTLGYVLETLPRYPELRELEALLLQYV